MNTIKDEATKQFEENIVKTIKLIIYEKGYAYIIDVARELNINQNTMYSAIKRMVQKGYIEPLGPKGGKNERHSLKLTSMGDELAQKILDRHELLENWLIRLGLPAEQAKNEACSMEHGLTDASFELLRAHVEMASRHMETTLKADEIIARLDDEMGMDRTGTITFRMQKMVEQLGGIEGAERKRKLVARAGGEDKLEQLLEIAEANGGVDKTIETFSADREEITALLALEDKYGTAKEIDEALKKFERIKENMKLLIDTF